MSGVGDSKISKVRTVDWYLIVELCLVSIVDFVVQEFVPVDLSVCFEELYRDLQVVLFVVIPLMRGWFSCDFAAMFLKDCFSFKPIWEVVFTSPVYSFWPICEGPCYFDSRQVRLLRMMSL